MKRTRILFLCLFLIISWHSTRAEIIEPIVTIEKSPIEGDESDYVTESEVTFKTTITYPTPAPGHENDPKATVVSFSWNFNDPTDPGNINGYTSTNPTMTVKHTFKCGMYIVALSYTTSSGISTTIYDNVITMNSLITSSITTAPSVCVIPGTNPSVYDDVQLTSDTYLSAYPTYKWSIINPSGAQTNSDYLIFYNGANANNVTSQDKQTVYVNFNKYPASFPVTIQIRCEVQTAVADGSCTLANMKSITFKQGITAPVACNSCASNNLFKICPDAPAIQLGAAPVAGISYAWTASTGALQYLSAANISNPTFTPQPGAPANISYTLTATSNSNSCWNSAQVNYQLNTLAVSVPANVSICKNAVITATASGGSGSYSYQWSSTDNNVQELSATNIANPTFTCVERKIKTFQVKVTDQVALCSVTKTVTVDFKNNTLNAISGYTLDWCNAAHTISADHLFSGGTAPFLLSTAGATPTATLQASIFAVSTPQAGNVTITDNDGCSVNSSYTVNTTPLTISSIQYNTPLSASFRTSNINGYGGHIYTVCNTDSSALDITFTVNGGCAGYTYYWVATTSPYSTPMYYFDYSTGQPYLAIPFSNNPGAVGTVLSSNTFRSTIKFRTDQYVDYRIALIVKDANGAITGQTITDVETQRFLLPVLTNTCDGQNVTTVATHWQTKGTTSTTWTYPGDAQLISQADNSVTLYYPNQTVANVSFNTANTCGTNTVTTTYKSGIPLDAGADRTICTGNNVTMNVIGGGSESFTWSPATGLSSTTIKNPVASPTATTTYTVSIKPLGCNNAITDNVQIYVVNSSNPPSWKRGFLSSFYTPAVDNVVSDPGSNQIYYRTADNHIHSMWWNSDAQEWGWSGLADVDNAAGDLAIAPDGQLFYRTTSNQLHSLKWTPATGWQHVVPVDWITNVQGPIVATNSQVFYRTIDNKIHSIYMTAPDQWAWSEMNQVANSNVGNAMAFSFADWRLYYRTQDSKLNFIYWTGNNWNRTDLSSVTGTVVGNSITCATNGTVFYKTTSNGIRSVSLSASNWIGTGYGLSNVAGDLFCDIQNRIFFRTTENTINYISSATSWQVDKLNSSTYPNGSGIVISSNIPYANITVPNNGNVYFRTADGRIRCVYYEGNCEFKIPNTRAPENPSNTVAGVHYTDSFIEHSALTDTYCSGGGNINTIRIPGQDMYCTIEDGVGIKSPGAKGVQISYTGYIYVPDEGTYNFYLTSHDGSNMYIGNKLVVDNGYGTGHPTTTASGLIALKAGKHIYTINKNNVTDGAEISLSYEGPSTPKQKIPDNAYFILATTYRLGEMTSDINSDTTTSVDVYPNPFTNSLKFLVTTNKTKEAQQAIVQLYDLMGKEVYNGLINTNKEEEIMINTIPGLYIGKVIFEDGTVYQFKVTKE
ncbi:MAG TPA: PA14 domain-containing protein [Cytophagaceae bacterium]|nr:PA14 domain-containing protein [Cytophagaceae bacterium]